MVARTRLIVTSCVHCLSRETLISYIKLWYKRTQEYNTRLSYFYCSTPQVVYRKDTSLYICCRWTVAPRHSVTNRSKEPSQFVVHRASAMPVTASSWCLGRPNVQRPVKADSCCWQQAGYIQGEVEKCSLLLSGSAYFGETPQPISLLI
jgi:hypothetical protein